MPIIVMAQEARDVARISVGENASPLPLLSVGASVIMVSLDFICVQAVLSLPR